MKNDSFSSFKQRLRVIFDQIDQEGFGEVPVDLFIEALKQPDIQEQVPINKRELLYERAMKVNRRVGAFTFDDFVSVVSRSHQQTL